MATDPGKTSRDAVARLTSDYMKSETRGHRRTLMLISGIAIVVALLNLQPTTVSALGVTITSDDRCILLWALVVVVFYFLVAFVIYGLNDLMAAWVTRVEIVELTAPLRAALDEKFQRLSAKADAGHAEIETKLRELENSPGPFPGGPGGAPPEEVQALKSRVDAFKKETDRERAELRQMMAGGSHLGLVGLAERMSNWRLAFDFGVPIVTAVAALVLLGYRVL